MLRISKMTHKQHCSTYLLQVLCIFYELSLKEKSILNLLTTIFYSSYENQIILVTLTNNTCLNVIRVH